MKRLFSKERGSNLWWEDKVERALNEDEERRLFIEKRKIYLSISMMIFSSILYIAISSSILNYKAFRQIPWATTIEISSILVIVLPLWIGSFISVQLIAKRQNDRRAAAVLQITRKILSYTSFLYSAVYLSLSALFIPRQKLDESILSSYVRENIKWTALTPCPVDENLIFFTLGITTYSFFVVATESKTYDLITQVILILTAMIGAALYKGRQVESVVFTEFDTTQTTLSESESVDLIRNDLILTSGLLTFHVINTAFALAVLISASITARSFAKTMNNIRTYRKLVEEEEDKIDNQLRRMLPETAIFALKTGTYNYAAKFPEVSVLFAEIVGFDAIGSRPRELMHYLNKMFREFDALVEKRGVYKVETINAVYVIASGLPAPQKDHAKLAALVAHDLMDAVEHHKINGQKLKLKVGIHSGAIVAGLIGKEHPRFRLFGDTMNTSARMETTSEPGKIQLSAATMKKVKKYFEVEKRGKIPVKGKGEMTTWCLGKYKNDNPDKVNEIFQQETFSTYRIQSQKSERLHIIQGALQAIEDMKENKSTIRPVDLKAEQLTGPLASMNLELKYESSKGKDRQKGTRNFPGVQVNPKLNFIKIDSAREEKAKQQSPRSFLSSASFVTESTRKAAASKYFSRSNFSIQDVEQAFIKKYTHVRARHTANGMILLTFCTALAYYRLFQCTYLDESSIDNIASKLGSSKFKIDCRDQFICYNKTWGVALENIGLGLVCIGPIFALVMIFNYISKKSSRVVLGLKWGKRTVNKDNVLETYSIYQYAYFAWLQSNYIALQEFRIRMFLNHGGIFGIIIILTSKWTSGKWQRPETMALTLVVLWCSLLQSMFRIKDMITFTTIITTTFVTFSLSNSEQFLRGWLMSVILLAAVVLTADAYLIELAIKGGFCELEEVRERQANNNRLLDSMIPPRIQKIMKASPTKGLAVQLSNCCVLLADIEGFTSFSAQLPPEVLVTLLNQLFSAFDAACKYYEVTKIETIGDAYLAATGCLPSANAIRRTKSLPSGNNPATQEQSHKPKNSRGSFWKSIFRGTTVRPDTTSGHPDDRHVPNHIKRSILIQPHGRGSTALSRKAHDDSSNACSENAQGHHLGSLSSMYTSMMDSKMPERSLCEISDKKFSPTLSEGEDAYRAVFRPNTSPKGDSSDDGKDKTAMTINRRQKSVDVKIRSRKRTIDLVTDNYKRMMEDIKKQDDCDRLASFALEMQEIIQLIDVPESVQLPEGRKHLRLRIGLHRGPTIGGIVGNKMLRYHLFGDTVDIAGKCEQSCVPGRVHVTDDFARLLSGAYECEAYLDDIHGHKTFLINKR